MVYAMLKSGGKQIKVVPGEFIWIEKVPFNLNEEIIFDDVLALSCSNGFFVGQPKLNAKVKGIVIKQGSGPKIRILRFKEKSNWQKKQGHRQKYTKVYISEIIHNETSIAKKAFENKTKSK